MEIRSLTKEKLFRYNRIHNYDANNVYRNKINLFLLIMRTGHGL